MTDVFESVGKWRTLRQHLALENKTIGFVPTMGNLHAGHQSLLRRAKQENEISVLSIFVNPTQFDNANDLAKYPRTFSQDFVLAESLGVDYVLLPSYDELYADSYRYRITESKLSQCMEGQHRNGHFDGVLTVVMKLLMLVKSTQAYFGEKDFQQLQLVSDMTKAFFIDTKIVAYPTVRDQNGLALSSRNSQLTREQYQRAIQFPKLLVSAKTLAEIKHDLEQLSFIVDYIEEFQGRRYGAVRLGAVRLIDNIDNER